MTDITEADEWLTLEALERLDRQHDAEQLAQLLASIQPEWHHSLVIGIGAMPAVLSERQP